ncbi:acyl-CoA reductase [Dyadobacter arcticus]|uniref:Acyl-CoA reductase (LuxC) n=1 Tax=Dyadobacter arcticus TaxID=1078754 RepID=A0ABX0UMM6_9BACT|nr:acyl-CoA reductase [Dyadobacter arcticus]NIJ54259.1 hypothetical protein [Dyadobacter arcticus]
MISRTRRVEAFINLGRIINEPAHKEVIEDWVDQAKSKNNWFTRENVFMSLKAIAIQFLDEKKLISWSERYPEPASYKKVGVVMAGNIPAVGFHDALCVLISGHTLLAKQSSDDEVLIQALLKKLTEIEPDLKDHIIFADRLNDADAYIATGSNNTARYFHYYFAKKPNVIRRNRTSVAVLNGSETTQELAALGRDVLQYYGLGCRNVSKLFVPSGYDFTKFYESIADMESTFLHHHKYFNNYEYNKSIFLINRVPHLDNGFLMITEGDALVSPISVLHYHPYETIDEVEAQLSDMQDKIQCVIGNVSLHLPGSLDFGSSQQPGLSDYADSIDTMQFLAELS